MFYSMKNSNHLVDFHDKLMKCLTKKNNLILISKDGQRFDASKKIIFAFSAKIKKECTGSEYHMKCDKTILAPMLQLIHFGKTNDMIALALKAEFDNWMKYYEIEIGPIVSDQFKEIEILPSTSNGFKLNSRNLEPMDSRTIAVEATTTAHQPIPISSSFFWPEAKKQISAKPKEAAAPNVVIHNKTASKKNNSINIETIDLEPPKRRCLLKAAIPTTPTTPNKITPMVSPIAMTTQGLSRQGPMSQQKLHVIPAAALAPNIITSPKATSIKPATPKMDGYALRGFGPISIDSTSRTGINSVKPVAVNTKKSQ